MQTAWPRRLKPLLDVLEELGCEPRAVLSEQLFPDAPIGNLNLSTIVGRSTADMKPFLNKLSAAIHGRPNDNELWQDVCGPLRFVKVPQGLVVVFERAIGTLRPPCTDACAGRPVPNLLPSVGKPLIGLQHYKGFARKRPRSGRSLAVMSPRADVMSSSTGGQRPRTA
jgi:hypothetical protein